MKRLLTATIVAIATALTAPSTHAQWQPSGPIKFLIGFRAGGGADTMVRMMSEDLAAEKGWTVIPENVPGAGGGVMARAVKDAPADGLTLGIGVSSTFTYNFLSTRDPGYKFEDFKYISSLAGSQMAVVAKKESGWDNLSDVISVAKSGKEISFGTVTQRQTDAAHYIGKVNDVKFNIVSSLNGGRAVLNAITADDIDIGFIGGIQKDGVKSGELVNLVNAEDQPLAVSPDSQTLKEVGVDFYFGGTFIVVAPAGIPEEAEVTIAEAIAEVVQNPESELNKYITKVFSHKLKSGDEIQKFMEQELADSEKLLEATSN